MMGHVVIQAATIQAATIQDSEEIAGLVGDLLSEIMHATDANAFNFDVAETTQRLNEFLIQGKYFAFIARDENHQAIGCLTLYESYALYAEGRFGTIAELYVLPAYRAQNIGRRLLAEARSFGKLHNWKRLEVTTPPLPHFEKTLAFYLREDFAVSGGRKLKFAL